jgi:hypothetical protein
MSFVRVDRVEDVRVRFHRFPQLCVGKSTGELVEVEERFLVRRGAFERRSVRGATKHSFLPSFRARACSFLSLEPRGGVLFVRSSRGKAFKDLYGVKFVYDRTRNNNNTRESALFFFCFGRKILPFFSSSSQKIRRSFGARIGVNDTTTTTTTTREDLRVSDPGASRSSRFVSLDFRARALRKDA